MNTILEYEAGMHDIEVDETSANGSIEIYGMVSANSLSMIHDDDLCYTITTPIPSTFTIGVDAKPQLQLLAVVQLSQFSASQGSLPVCVYDAPKIGDPVAAPHVRIILTNAIITADPCLQILATIEAFHTGDGVPILVSTPNGILPVYEGIPVNWIVYSVNQSDFTAKNNFGTEVDIAWSYQPNLSKEIAFELSALKLIC